MRQNGAKRLKNQPHTSNTAPASETDHINALFANHTCATITVLLPCTLFKYAHWIWAQIYASKTSPESAEKL